MLNPDDRRAIEGLFDRLAEVERKSPNRDADAARLIDQSIVRQPAAPYYLAQTVLVQEQALEGAEQRIRELEEKLAQRERSGSFGRPNGPWDRAGRDDRDDRYDQQQQRGGFGGGWGGGGFLAGAAQTAMGVAGGVLLGNAIAGMFGVGSAHASEGNHDNGGQDNGNDQGSDNGSDSGGDAGGDSDFGGGGDFDMGGDF